MEEKLELVERHRGEHSLNHCLRALGVSKGTWYGQKRRRREGRDRDGRLKARVLEVVRDHPAYGYRRIQRELEARLGMRINHKRLRRLLNEWDLALPRKVSRPKPSGIQRILRRGQGELNLVQGWTPGVLEMLSTDFTEIRYTGGSKKAYLMAMLDPASAWVPGWAVGARANRELALRCWKRTKEQLEQAGWGTTGLIVHQDQDSVYTSYGWLRALLIEAEAVVSYSERGAQDNPWIESFWGHFKGENGSLLWEAETLVELERVIDERMSYYNTERRHSSIDYLAPVEYLRKEGIHLRPLVEIGPPTGSVLGAQVRGTAQSRRRSCAWFALGE